MVPVKPTPEQRVILADIVSGFEDLPSWDDPYERNKERLRLMDRARKVSLDPRAVDPNIQVRSEGGKIASVVDRTARIYEKWDADKGTQLIFLDRSVPKSKGDDKIVAAYDALRDRLARAQRDGDEGEAQSVLDALDKYDPNEMEALRNALNGGWNAYDEIKRQLVAKGIPASEIRYVQEASTDKQKADLFDLVRNGDVRVLLGSTQRMGAGTNVQDRLVALHHVDVGWKPSDIEQREGRIVRQGNKLLEKYGEDFAVDVIAYATEMTIDAKMWALNAAKLKAINGIRKYDGAFEMEFEDQESASMAEMAALATGNPLMVERVALDGDIKKLEMQQRSYTKRVYAMRDKLQHDTRRVETAPAEIKGLTEFADQLDANLKGIKKRSAARSLTVQGKTYNGPVAAEAAADAAIKEIRGGDDKARFSIEIGGKKLTSKDKVEEAINKAFGTADFEAEVDGTKHIGLTDAARAIVDKIAAQTESAFTLEGVTINGAKVEVDVQPSVWGKTKESIDVTLSAVNDAGRSMAGYTSKLESGTATTNGIRPLVAKIAEALEPRTFRWQAEATRNEAARAEKEIPSLKIEAAKPWEKAEELTAKRDRLKNVITELAASDDRRRFADAMEREREAVPVERQKPVSFDPAQDGSSKLLAAITAYHGTPHDFEAEPEHPAGRFRSDKIGTGEGAQAYTHGLYFAGNEAIGRFYKEALANRHRYRPKNNYEEMALSYLGSAGGDRSRAIKSLESSRDMYRSSSNPQWRDYEGAAQLLRSGWAPPRPTEGRLYKVSLDVEPGDLLDWDRPISEQNENVRRAAQQFIDADNLDKPLWIRRHDRLELFREGQPPDVDWMPGLADIEERDGKFHVQSDSYEADFDTEAEAKGAAEDYVRRAIKRSSDAAERMPGSKLVSLLEERLGRGDAISKHFLSHGVPGLQYLDATSRRQDATALYKGSDAWKKGNPDGLGEAVTEALSYAQAHGSVEAAIDLIKDAIEFGNYAPAIVKQLYRDVLNVLESGDITVRRSNETHNYVIYDDSRIKITHKDGSPVTAEERKAIIAAIAGGAAQAKGYLSPAAIRSAVSEGKTATVPHDVIAEAHAVIKAHAVEIPKDVRAGTLLAVEPVGGAAGAEARLVFVTPSGARFAAVIDRRDLAGYRALYAPENRGMGLFHTNWAGGFTPKELVDALSGRIRHETPHALRSTGRYTVEEWARLLDHAQNLQILDWEAKAFFTLINDPSAANAPDGKTLRDYYDETYKDDDEYDELIDQEHVAHASEFLSNLNTRPVGDPVREEMLPRYADVIDIYHAMFTGEIAARDPYEVAAYNRGEIGALGGERGAANLAVADRPAAKDAIKLAERMEAAGKDRDAIWESTAAYLKTRDPALIGVFRGVDGKWRFEIDDSRSRWKGPDWQEVSPGNAVRGKFSAFIDHPDLFVAYPAPAEFRTNYFRVDPNRLPPNGSVPHGSYNPQTKELAIKAAPPEFMAPRSTGMHEIQHAIQEREGFASGGNINNRINVQLYNQLSDHINTIKEEARGGLTAKQAAEIDRLREIQKAIFSSPEEAYRRLAGEVDARNVQTRLNMTPDERRLSPPWKTQDVPDEQQIVRYGNSLSASIRGALTGGGGIPPSRGPAQPQQPPAEIKSLADIIADLKSALGLAATQGRQKLGIEGAASGKRRNFGVRPNVAGQYEQGTGGVRYKLSTDIETIAHEGGHHLEQVFGQDLGDIKDNHRAELEAMAYPGAIDKLSEGFAEFFRQYITDPAAARIQAPNFYDDFEDSARRPRSEDAAGLPVRAIGASFR